MEDDTVWQCTVVSETGYFRDASSDGAPPPRPAFTYSTSRLAIVGIIIFSTAHIKDDFVDFFKANVKPPSPIL